MARFDLDFQLYNLGAIAADWLAFGGSAAEDLVVVAAADAPAAGLDRGMSLADAPLTDGPVSWTVPGLLDDMDMLSLVRLGSKGLLGARVKDAETEVFAELRLFGGDGFLSISYKRPAAQGGDSIQTGELNIGAVGDYVWSRFQIEGTTARVKVWNPGELEPEAWTKTLALVAGLGPGQPGLGRHAGTTPGALVFMSVSDDLEEGAARLPPLSLRTLTTVDLVQTL